MFGNNYTCVKKDDPSFDVAMGAYDGAEICELVGLYLLSQLSNVTVKSKTGLYRDDGLIVLHKATGNEIDRIRKRILDMFKENGLKITVESNLIQTDFLDITLNLETDQFWPYRKPYDKPIYIHKFSNHPTTIKKQLPNMIEKRLSGISCSEQQFRKATNIYDEALDKSGFNHKLKFNSRQETKQKTRKQNIIWFNPPYSDHVASSIGRSFLKLLDKNFLPAID